MLKTTRGSENDRSFLSMEIDFISLLKTGKTLTSMKKNTRTADITKPSIYAIAASVRPKPINMKKTKTISVNKGLLMYHENTAYPTFLKANRDE
jgi:hypothetical protein